MMGVKAGIGGVLRRGFARALVSLGLHDEAHERFEIEFLIGEIIGKGRKEFFVAGRIRDAHVIDGLNEPDGHKISPDAIHDRAREVGIVAGDKPIGEGISTIFCGVNRQRLAIKRRGRLRFACKRLDEIAGIRYKYDVVTFTRAGLGADSGEEIGHLVILIVGPFLHWMVVTLGAIDGHAEKRLRSSLGHRARVVVKDIKIGRAIFERAALCGDNFASEHVPGSVLSHFVAYPIVIRPDGRRFELFGADEQQIGPFIGPVIHKFGTAKQRFDEPVAFGRRFVAQESASFFSRRQNSSGIDVSTADELGIAATWGRRQVEVLQFFEDELVDEISALCMRECRFGEFVGEGNGDGRNVDATQIPRSDSALTETNDFGLTVVGNLGNSFVRGSIFGPGYRQRSGQSRWFR